MMRSNSRGPTGASGAAHQQEQRRGGVPRKNFPRRGGAAPGSASASAATAAVELTRVQQIEAKAARDAVIASAPKSSPAAAKKFVEAISLDVDVEAARQLLLSRKGFAAIPNSIGVLCQQLRKLDVSNNDLTDLSPLASLQHLSNLNVAHNTRLASLKGLAGTCLSVLNISFCAVESLAGLEHTALTLRTLIANDNRLKFQSPLFRTGGGNSSGELHDGDAATAAELQTDLSAASAHVPASLRASVPVDTTAMRNFTLFATFQQCETLVLSRNAQLARCFPAWSAEELAAACGDQPRKPTRGSDDDSAEEDGGSEEGLRGTGHGNAQESAGDAEADGGAANKELKHAIALAHPLSVFERLPRLKKLSLSGCELHSLPSRWFLPMVTELRLAQNHLTSLQPDGVILRSLHILDISNNLFVSVVTLRRCRFLEQLNVRGNPLVEEGAAQDRAAGVRAEEGSNNASGESVSASSTAAVPLNVQQRVARLFPAVKLLDNQPLLTAAEMRGAFKRGREAAAQAAVTAETEKSASLLDGDASDGTEHVEDKSVGGQKEKGEKGSVLARNATQSTAAARHPARKAPRVDAAAIAAEADEKDVVIEAPSSVLKTAHAPIVRRERVLLRPGAAQAKGGDARKRGGATTAAAPAPTLLGQAAVNKVLEQNRKPSAW